MRSLVAWLMETLFDWGNFGKQDFDLSIFFFETRFRHGAAGVLSEVDVWFATSVRCLPRAVAQLGSALDWGSRGRRFKSCQPDWEKEPLIFRKPFLAVDRLLAKSVTST